MSCIYSERTMVSVKREELSLVWVVRFRHLATIKSN
jgi:hypothetical protein